MASTLLRRQLARAPSKLTSRACIPALSVRRSLSSTSAVQAEEVTNARAARARGGLDVHTVEDFHGMTASEILEETGVRPESQMRHFTGTPAFGPRPWGSR